MMEPQRERRGYIEVVCANGHVYTMTALPVRAGSDEPVVPRYCIRCMPPGREVNSGVPIIEYRETTVSDASAPRPIARPVRRPDVVSGAPAV